MNQTNPVGGDKLEGMEYVISKIDAAVDPLDWSIRLFLDHQAYVPAITLAGAAEEIIGETLSEQSAVRKGGCVHMLGSSQFR